MFHYERESIAFMSDKNTDLQYSLRNCINGWFPFGNTYFGDIAISKDNSRKEHVRYHLC